MGTSTGLYLLLLTIIWQNATAQQLWNANNYPDPIIDFQKCGMKTSSLLCDPDGILTEAERGRLNYELQQLETRTRQDTAPDICKKKGVTAGMALARRVQGGSEKAVQEMATRILKNWQIDPECKKAVVFVMSVDDRKFFSVQDRAVPVSDAEITQLFQQQRDYFRNGQVSQGLQSMIKAFWNKILSKKVKQPATTQRPPDKPQTTQKPVIKQTAAPVQQEQRPVYQQPTQPPANKNVDSSDSGSSTPWWKKMLWVIIILSIVIAILGCCCCYCLYKKMCGGGGGSERRGSNAGGGGGYYPPPSREVHHHHHYGGGAYPQSHGSGGGIGSAITKHGPAISGKLFGKDKDVEKGTEEEHQPFTADDFGGANQYEGNEGQKFTSDDFTGGGATVNTGNADANFSSDDYGGQNEGGEEKFTSDDYGSGDAGDEKQEESNNDGGNNDASNDADAYYPDTEEDHKGGGGSW